MDSKVNDTVWKQAENSRAWETGLGSSETLGEKWEKGTVLLKKRIKKHNDDVSCLPEVNK